MDAATLQRVTGCSPARAALFALPLTDAMAEFGITTPVRQAAFLAQIAHESLRLERSREIWGPTPSQVRYEGRRDLGNTQPGDGKRYMGRGLIQITGRSNYAAASKPMAYDLVADPSALEEPELAAQSAAWWWAEHSCNVLADAGNFDAITRRINGGLTGKPDRDALWAQAKEVLSV